MSTIVGMFDEQQQAQKAIDALDGLGLEEGAIHVLSRRGLNTGNSLLASLARAISAGDGALSSELIRLGLDREEAEFYEEEMGDETVVVVVKADGETGDEAMSVMRQANAALKND